MTRLLPAILSSLLVSGCQVPFSADSPLTPVPEQSTLLLHQPLTIPPQSVSLWFQNGQQLPENDLDHYYPHCKFETLKIQEIEKTIQPDTFVIHKVVRWNDYARQPIRLASAPVEIKISVSGADNGGPGHVNTATEMFLRSDKQPDVYRLVCSQWEDAAERTHVTINQIRRTLGDIFSLNLPAELPIKEKPNN